MPQPPWIRFGAWLTLAVLVLATLAQGGGHLRWGDGLELVAVASHFGVAHPPGYPVFTALLGALAGMGAADPYLAALWLCRLLACAVAFVLALTLRGQLRRRGAGESTALVTSLLFALAFLFGGSLWPTMHVVEVYGLHALLIALLAWLLVYAEVPLRGRILLVAAALQGLALAHHLTAAAMLPLTAVAIHAHARAGERRAAMLAAVLVIALPLLLYASLLARAPGAQEQAIVWGGLQNLGELSRHVRGSEYGASQFLMADPHTRFTFGAWVGFAGERLVQLVTSAGRVFAGPTAAAPLLGLVATVLAAIGARDLLRRRRAVGFALLAAFALQIGFVITYNIADIADYFLAIHVLALPLVVDGLWVASYGLSNGMTRGRGSSRWLPALPAVLLLLTVPLNAKTARPDSAEITARYQSRLLGALPEGAAVVTAESGDLFLLWYTRFAVGARQDLVVVPANLMDRPWVRTTLPPADPRRAAIGFRAGSLQELEPYVADLRTLVLEPLLDHGRVFTTLRNPEVLEELARHYEFRTAAELLKRDELDQLRSDDLPRAPAVLWELRRPVR